MTPTATPSTELTPELIDRVMKLSPEDQDRLVEMLDELNMPPGPDAAEIARRSAEVAAGTAVLLTREESEAQIREAIRKLGVEL